MKNKEMIMIAAGLFAGAVALIIAKHRRSASGKSVYSFFKRNRHLTPAFTDSEKHS